jgi:hypothetical protein
MEIFAGIQRVLCTMQKLGFGCPDGTAVCLQAPLSGCVPSPTAFLKFADDLAELMSMNVCPRLEMEDAI